MESAVSYTHLVDGEFVFNPTAAQKEVSDLALTVASTKEKVIMIEAGAKEVPEAKMGPFFICPEVRELFLASFFHKSCCLWV